jgi:hypothetical protein
MTMTMTMTMTMAMNMAMTTLTLCLTALARPSRHSTGGRRHSPEVTVTIAEITQREKTEMCVEKQGTDDENAKKIMKKKEKKKKLKRLLSKRKQIAADIGFFSG